MSTELQAVRIRVEQAVRIASEREGLLGREGFAVLPARVQNQLSVMQNQAPPAKQSLEGLLAAEHNLAAYQDKLRRALDLVSQAANQQRRDTDARRRSSGVVLIGVSLAALVAAAGFLAYRRGLAAKAAECRATDECVEDGLCGARLRTAPAPIKMLCAPRNDEDCAGIKSCVERGQCSASAEGCIAAKDEDCAATTACQQDGACSAVAGHCVIATAQDCRRTERCTREGACTPLQGRCVAGSDADCRQSVLCEERKACLEVQGRCVVEPESLSGAPKASAARRAPKKRPKMRPSKLTPRK